MTTKLRTMTQDQRTILQAVEGELTAQELVEKFAGTFEAGRVRGLLASLRFRGLVSTRSKNKSLKWFRTTAGDTIVEKLRTGTYGR